MIGHTGSGKSTLIQHLNGLIRPTSGKIYFDDEDIYADGYPLRELRGKLESASSIQNISCLRQQSWMMYVLDQ